MLASSVVYVLVSLLSGKKDFNMDKMLHRGAYAVEERHRSSAKCPSRGLKMLGMGKEFTRGDKIIYIAAYTWTFTWAAVFLVGTWINLTTDVSDTILDDVLEMVHHDQHRRIGRASSSGSPSAGHAI